MGCRVNNPGWFRVLCDNGSFVMKEFLKSLKWESQQLESLGMNDIELPEPEPAEKKEGDEDE